MFVIVANYVDVPIVKSLKNINKITQFQSKNRIKVNILCTCT